MKRQTKKEIDKKLIVGKAAKITWGDAHGKHFIENVEDMTELAEIESVGWLIFSNKEVITICNFKVVPYLVENFEDLKDKFRYYIVIPRKTIWRVRLL